LAGKKVEQISKSFEAFKNTQGKLDQTKKQALSKKDETEDTKKEEAPKADFAPKTTEKSDELEEMPKKKVVSADDDEDKELKHEKLK